MMSPNNVTNFKVSKDYVFGWHLMNTALVVLVMLVLILAINIRWRGYVGDIAIAFGAGVIITFVTYRMYLFVKIVRFMRYL
jgi:hypothetical protein